MDVPGLGSLGGGDFAGGPDLAMTLAEADEEDRKFDTKGQAPMSTVLEDASLPGQVGPSAALPPAALPPTGNPFPPPGGRPPGYDTSGGAGSPSRGAMSLLASAGSAAAAGYYFRDPRAAAAGFLVAGSALNLYHGKTEGGTEGTWSTAASLVGLGLGAYLAYQVTQGKK